MEELEPGRRIAIARRIEVPERDRREVSVLDAYTGNSVTRNLQPGGTLSGQLSLQQFFGWYDLIVTVAGDSTFNYRLAGHVETGKDSFSDPALGGLVTLGG